MTSSPDASTPLSARRADGEVMGHAAATKAVRERQSQQTKAEYAHQVLIDLAKAEGKSVETV